MDTARRRPLTRPGLDRWLILASLVLLTVLAWAYLVYLTAAMARGDLSAMGLPELPMGEAMASGPLPWTPGTFVLMSVMWWIMMIGMMTPSALPMIMLYDRVHRHHAGHAVAARQSALFVLGYLLAWGIFSLAATSLQWGLQAAGLLGPMSLSAGAEIGAVLFAAAGIYQLSPLKSACLRHCRSPAEFLTRHRRAGPVGAWIMGGHHGLYCIGCCWLLMLLLFGVGVMNLAWVAALAVVVLLEKLAPRGQWLARITGLTLIAGAVWLAASN